MKKIVLTGGGTAGHIYPALALLPKLKEYEVHYIGSNGMEKDILKKFPKIIYHEIPTVKLIRKFTFKNFFIPFKLFFSVLKAKKILNEIKPNIIFSKGGFVSVPVVIAGKRLNIPVISHESDLSMGLANKIILKRCNVMCTTFLETSKLSPKCKFTGQPIREEILDGNPSLIKSKFYDNKPCLLVIGGSLGAKFINEKIIENLDQLLSKFNVVHITGKGNVKEINKDGYMQVEFASNIGDYYSSADIVITRGGSGVINELLCLNKLMLIIPLSKKCSRGDQIENAKLFKKIGYCEYIEEENFNNEKFLKLIDNLLNNKSFYKENMKKANANNANEKIIDLIKKTERKDNWYF